MSDMTGLPQTESCARCDSMSDVRVVKYMRGEEKFTELWCRRCRHEKLRPKGKVRRPANGVVVTATLILAIAALMGMMLWAFTS